MLFSERRRVLSVATALSNSIARSPLNMIELDVEPAICDFITDFMLNDGPYLATSLRAVLKLAQLDQQLDKPLHVITSRPCSRADRASIRTLLQQAARDGDERLVEVAMVMLLEPPNAAHRDG